MRTIAVATLLLGMGCVGAFSPTGGVKAGIALRSAGSSRASCRGIRSTRTPNVGFPLMCEKGAEAGEAAVVPAEKAAPSPVSKKAPMRLYGPKSGAPTWKMVMSLTGAPEEGTLVGSGAEVELSAKMQFWEDDGFEPPQGKIAVDDNRFIGRSKSYWKLDEDPTKGGFDKAGFWIWGLFEEPQYPFLTFELEVKEEIKLAEGIIPVGSLYGQAKITRDKEKGISLSEGLLTVRKNVTLKVDLLGLSEGILQDVIACGTFTLTHV